MLQNISDAERLLMKLIWERHRLSFSDIMTELEPQGKDLKSSTVRTFLARFIEKGYLNSERSGHSVYYSPAITEQEYLSAQTTTFVNSMFDGDIKGLFASLFGQEVLDRETMDDLADFWRKTKEGE